MARIKATSSDVFARLARAECANYHNGGCQGNAPCTVINGESCQYFCDYVRPLLDNPDFSARYAREAKVAVALNPKAKVVRKRRQAVEPKLALESTPPQPAVPRRPAPVAKKKPVSPPPAPPATHTKPARPAQEEKPVTTRVTAAGDVVTRPPGTPAKKPRTGTPRAVQEQPLLFLEMAPTPPAKRPAKGKRR